MAEMIPCKLCKQLVASNADACPKCGTPDPGLYGSGKLLLHRRKFYVASLGSMDVFIDGEKACALANGKTLSLNIEAGAHKIYASFFLGSISDPYYVKIRYNEIIELELSATYSFGHKPNIKRILK